jgi:hypothetical protein
MGAVAALLFVSCPLVTCSRARRNDLALVLLSALHAYLRWRSDRSSVALLLRALCGLRG